MFRLIQLQSILLSSTEQERKTVSQPAEILSSFGKFNFMVFNNKYKEQVLQMCIQEFSQHYPLTTAFCRLKTERSGKDIETKFWNIYIDELATNGLSVIAVDTETDEVVGGVLAMDYIKFQSFHDEENQSLYDASLQSLRDHLFNLAPLEYQELMMEKGRVIEQFALVVKSQFNSLGIMKEMMKSALWLNKQRGYDYVFLHPTNCVSEHLCQKNNFTLISQCQSKNFWCKSTRPFKLVQQKHKRATFYIKKL